LTRFPRGTYQCNRHRTRRSRNLLLTMDILWHQLLLRSRIREHLPGVSRHSLRHPWNTVSTMASGNDGQACRHSPRPSRFDRDPADRHSTLIRKWIARVRRTGSTIRSCGPAVTADLRWSHIESQKDRSDRRRADRSEGTTIRQQRAHREHAHRQEPRFHSVSR
jgi:hypothetical protein